MSKEIEEIAWSDNDELDVDEIDAKKKRCVFCHELLKQSTSQFIVAHEKTCKIAKKCNVSRVLCKSGIKKFVCDVCYSTFEFLKSLVEHEKRHSPPGGYFCNYCDQRFCTDCEKQKHTEHLHKVYKCRICRNLFETSESYIDHIKVDHNGRQTELIPCEKCSRMFTSTKILQRHIDSNCGSNKQFQCDICHKCFTTKGILKTHMLIHAESKSCVCPYCGKGFNNKYQLKSHEISHTGEKPWKCNVCFAEFSWKQSLVTHSTLHTGVKPYICDCCGSRFSCTSNIIAHRKKRPDTCGLPQYCTQLSKVTPRPSIYNPEMLTTDLPIKVKKNLKVVKESDREKFKIKSNKKKKSLENIANKVRRSRRTKNKSRQNVIDTNKELLEKQTENNVLEENHEFQNKSSICKLHNTYEIDVKDKILNSTIIDGEDKEQPIFVVDEEKYIVNNVEIKCEDYKMEEQYNETTLVDQKIEENQNQSKEMETDNCLNLCDNLFNRKEIHVKQESENLTFTDNNSANNLQNNTEENCNLSESNNDNVDFDGDDFSEYNPEIDDLLIKKSRSIKSNLPKSGKKKRKVRSCKKVNTKNEEPVVRRRSKRFNITIASEIEIVPKKKRGRRKSLKTSRPKPLRKKTDLIKCPFCDSAVYRKYSLKKHIKRIHHKSDEEIFFVLASIEEKGPSLDCDICKKKFTGKLSYEKHYKLHGEDKSLIIPCHDCYGQRFFRNKEELKKHVRNEHNDLNCKECDKTFKLKSSFKEHVLRIHKNKPNPPEPTITCIKCGKLVKKCLLRDHERSNCGKEYLYECKTCSKKFSTAGILKEHMKIHTGELTAFCKFCSKGFRNKYQCQQHEMVHTGEKPFKCTYEGCTAAFAHRNNMINHYSLHTGLRRYMCSGCTERFSCISSLKAHWRTHADTCALHPENTTKAQFKVSLKKGNVIQS